VPQGLPPDGAAVSVVLAIDPGPNASAWLTLVDGRPAEFAVQPNEDLLPLLDVARLVGHQIVIEKVESFGMPVGAEVFEIVYWSGRFAQAAGGSVDRIGRKAVKLHLCSSVRAKDANVRQALIDRYTTPEQPAIGRKASPGPLYGIAGDVWSALAVAVTWADQMLWGGP